MIRGTWLFQRIAPCAANKQKERYSVGYGEIVNRHAGKLVPPTIHPKLSNIHPFQQSLAVITRALLSGFEIFDLLSFGFDHDSRKIFKSCGQFVPTFTSSISLTRQADF